MIETDANRVFSYGSEVFVNNPDVVRYVLFKVVIIFITETKWRENVWRVHLTFRTQMNTYHFA